MTKRSRLLDAMGRSFERLPDWMVKRATRGAKLSKFHRSIDANTSIAKRNRWTGRPHEHRREIARRLRQQERQA